MGGVAAVVAVVAFSLAPFAWIVLTSLKSTAEIDAKPPTVVPTGDLGFYEAVLIRENFPRYLQNSTIVAGTTTIIVVILGAMAAYPLARLPIPARGTILSVVLAASMFPQIAIIGGVYKLLQSLGLLNTYPGLILPYTSLTLPLAIWLLVSFFREIPPELEDAARVDGCGPAATLWRIFLPVAAPGVFTTAILVFIYAWNEFFFALAILTAADMQTVPVAIANFAPQHRVPWGEYAAAAVVASLPLVLLVLLLQRRIVAGLTAGAVKG